MVSLLDSFKRALEKRESRSSRRRLTLLAPGAVDFSSNDFLSLSTSPVLQTRFLHALGQSFSVEAGHIPLSSRGSRLLDGNSTYAEELERFVASFHDAPSGLLFNSGFDANVGVYSCIPQPGDLIIYDELIHASVHEGMRLSRAGKRVPFEHNSAAAFRDVLTAQIADDLLIADANRNVFVAVESLYSMDGDTAPIREILQIMHTLLPRGNGYLIVDEAHATGVFGPRGAGIVQELGVQEQVFIRTHTFGKALASQGGNLATIPEFHTERAGHN
jgi:8-amino-7-oxononanoate synthase